MLWRLRTIKTVLFEGSIAYRKWSDSYMIIIKICTKEVNKDALISNDDKRIIDEYRIATRAYGHYRLR